MAQINLQNSHYLNEKNRILPNSPADYWGKLDADYNIRTGNTFGETEEITLSKQEWKGADQV